MKKLFLLVALPFVLLLAGCKRGGGGSGVPVTLPKDSLIGTYKLTAFEVTGGGQTFTDANVSSWSGEMKISLDEFFQELEFNGNEFIQEGVYTLVWENPAHSAATLDIYDDSGLFLGQAFIDIAGYEVTVFTLYSDGGITYSEEDVWTKISDKV